MKFGETEQQKQLRLKRCMNVLKEVHSVPQSQFKPLEGVDNDPRRMVWDRNEDESECESEITAAEIIVLNKGKNRS